MFIFVGFRRNNTTTKHRTSGDVREPNFAIGQKCMKYALVVCAHKIQEDIMVGQYFSHSPGLDRTRSTQAILHPHVRSAAAAAAPASVALP